jgi:hypothetical protein
MLRENQQGKEEKFYCNKIIVKAIKQYLHALARDKRDVRGNSDCLKVLMFQYFIVSMFSVQVFTSSNVHELAMQTGGKRPRTMAAKRLMRVH